MRDMVRRIALLLIAATLCGCGGSSPGVKRLPSEEADYLQARKAYDDENYIRAAELLTAFVDEHPGSNRLDEALLLLGRSHQKTGENLLAIEDFNRLVRDFPQSSLREEAEFERARSNFEESLGPAQDPESTEAALDLMRAYTIRYPEGAFRGEAEKAIDACLERLALKAFYNAETYLKLRQPRGAVLYLEKALSIRSDFSRAGEALANLGRMHGRLGESEKARGAWERLLAHATPDRIKEDRRLSDLRREAEEALRILPPPATGEEAP